MAERNLVVRLSANSRPLTRGLRQAGQGVATFARGVGRAGKTVALLGAGVAALGTAGLVAMAVNAAQSTDRMAKLGASLNLPVAKVQELSLVADLSGTSMEDLSKAILRMQRTLGEGTDRTKIAVDQLSRALGRDLFKDGTGAVEVFRSILEAASKIQDPMARAAHLGAIFGRQWQTMGNLIQHGAETFALAHREVTGLGLGITQDGAAAVEKLNDQFTLATTRAANFARVLFSQAAPILSEFVNTVLDLSAAFIESRGGGAAFASEVLVKLLEGFASAARWLADMINKANQLAEALAPAAQLLGQVGSFIGGTGELIGGAVAVGRQAAAGNIGGATAILGELLDIFKGDDEEAREQTQVLRSIDRSVSRRGVVAVAG